MTAKDAASKDAEGKKVCTKCKKSMPLSSFSKHYRNSFGLRTTCKECERRRHQLHKLSLNLQKRVCTICDLDLPIEMFSLNIRSLGGYNSRCKSCLSKREKDRYLNKKRQIQASQRTYRISNPHKNYAHKAVNAACKSQMLHPLPCQICEHPKAEAHHHSYFPKDYLNVTWLCRRHHRAWHELFLPEVPDNCQTSEAKHEKD